MFASANSAQFTLQIPSVHNDFKAMGTVFFRYHAPRTTCLWHATLEPSLSAELQRQRVTETERLA